METHNKNPAVKGVLGLTFKPNLSQENHEEDLTRRKPCFGQCQNCLRVHGQRHVQDMFHPSRGMLQPPHFRKHNDLLEKVQRNVTRMVPELSEIYKERNDVLDLLPVEERRIKEDMTTTFEFSHQFLEIQ